MKLSFRKTIAIALTSTLAFSSCQKAETINKTNVSTLDRIEELNNTYEPSKNEVTNVANKSLLDFAMDDAMGAIAGAGWGSIAGPFGSFCLGSSMCAYMSVRDMYRVGVDSLVNPTANEPVISRNPYEFMGYIHNNTLSYILHNRNQFFQNGQINTQEYLDSTREYFKTFSELSNFELDDKTFYSHLEQLGSIYNGNILQGYDNLLRIQVITENTRDIMQSFWNTASAIESDQKRRSYYASYVDIVNDSKDLSDDEKRVILSASSVTVYSLLFHSANK